MLKSVHWRFTGGSSLKKILHYRRMPSRFTFRMSHSRQCWRLFDGDRRRKSSHESPLSLSSDLFEYQADSNTIIVFTWWQSFPNADNAFVFGYFIQRPLRFETVQKRLRFEYVQIQRRSYSTDVHIQRTFRFKAVKIQTSSESKRFRDAQERLSLEDFQSFLLVDRSSLATKTILFIFAKINWFSYNLWPNTMPGEHSFKSLIRKRLNFFDGISGILNLSSFGLGFWLKHWWRWIFRIFHWVPFIELSIGSSVKFSSASPLTSTSLPIVRITWTINSHLHKPGRSNGDLIKRSATMRVLLWKFSTRIPMRFLLWDHHEIPWVSILAMNLQYRTS